jgi:hypothetical protein
MKNGKCLSGIAAAALLLFLGNCGNVMVPDAPLRASGTAGAPGADGVVHVTGISLDYTVIALTEGGTGQQLHATVNPPNAANQTVLWASQNPLIAYVNSVTGEITPYAQGTSQITAITEDGGKSASCFVSVNPVGLANVTNFTAAPGNYEIALSWLNPADSGFDSVVINSSPAEGSLGSQQVIPGTPGTPGSYLVTGLFNGTTYSIRIRAHYSDNSLSAETSIIAIPASPVSEKNLANFIAAPATGVSANSATTTAHNEFISITRVWKKTGDAATFTGVFQAGTEYTATLTITAKSAYTFNGVVFIHAGASAITPVFGTDFRTAVVTISFPATAGVTVSGKITGGDYPNGLDGATVQLKNGSADYLGPVLTASDGTYTISGVAAGTYTIAVSKTGYSSATIASFTVTTANISGKTATLNLTVTELDLSGIIESPQPSTPPDTTVTLTTAQSAQYTAGSASWQTVGGGSVPSSGFEPGTQYKATFTLTAKGGWSFNGLSSPDFSYTGASVDVTTSGASAAVTITFPTVQWTEVDVNAETGAGTTLVSMLEWIRNNNGGGEGTNYTITLYTDEPAVPPQVLNAGDPPFNLINVNITIKGDSPGRTVTLLGQGALFTLTGGGPTQKVTLTLGEYITLEGIGSNNSSLIRVNAYASLVMEDHSKITGNTYSSSSSSSYGGGVYVGDNGSFTMNGGEISGNYSSSSYSSYGGGVCVSGSYGSLTMNGGEISGNYSSSYSYSYSSSSSGGGVYVSGSSSSLTMNGGEISGNSSSSHSYSYGGGVYVSGLYSSLTMKGGEISGNTANAADAGYALGGGVYFSTSTSSSFTMENGEISGNTANAAGTGNALGGGVYFSTSTSTSYSVTMKGGEISGNTANAAGTGNALGGGVYFSSSSSRSFTMENGIISGNTAKSGGGVYVDGTFTKTGGLIYGDTDTTPGAPANTATSGEGHAVLLSKGWKRNSDAAGNMSSDLAGPSGGWEQ